MSLSVEQVADLVGFPAFQRAAGRRSIADLFPRQKQRCGIYILRFDTGEFYVGQAVDVTGGIASTAKLTTTFAT